MDLGIINNIVEFHHSSGSDPNHRFRSWEHCYGQFKKARGASGKTDLDYLALHLAFYLASWGMFRASSQLLQKDYRVHIPTVIEVQRSKYYALKGLPFQMLLHKDAFVDTLIELRDKLHLIYKSCGVSPTDTLITKVIMGVFGAVPAYDNYFIKGLKRCHAEDSNRCPQKICQTFNEKSIGQLAAFYSHNKIEFTQAYRSINSNSRTYPHMKMVDMYFWNIGFNSTKDQP